MATVRIVVRGDAVVGVVCEISGGVDSNLNPCKQAIVEVIAKVKVLREGVVGTVGLFDTPHVLRVGGDILRVGVVRVGVLYRGTEHLVPEQLANVRDATGANLEGLVGKKGGIQVREQVSMCRTPLVVAREDALEGGHTVTIRLLNATQVGRVPAVGSIVAGLGDSTVDGIVRRNSRNHDASGTVDHIPVYTSGIGLPDINQRSWDGFAGVDIDVLHLKENIHTIGVQVFLHVLAHDFAPDIVRAVGDRGRQDAACVGGKNDRLGRGGAVVQDSGAVVVNCLPPLERGEVTTLLWGSWIQVSQDLGGLGDVVPVMPRFWRSCWTVRERRAMLRRLSSRAWRVLSHPPRERLA